MSAPGSPNHPVSQERSTQNDLAFSMDTTATPDSPNQQVFSPAAAALPTYAPTPFSLGSNDSFVPMSTTCPQPTFNIAVSKWFDMLVGDAAFENGMPNFDLGMDDLNPLDVQTPQEQERSSITSIASLITAYETPGQQVASPSSSSPQLLERSAPLLTPNAATEKLRWQAPETIVLQPHEHNLLRNFVQRISNWVCFSNSMKSRDDNELQIDLFDPTQSFSIFVPHLAVSVDIFAKKTITIDCSGLRLIAAA